MTILLDSLLRDLYALAPRGVQLGLPRVLEAAERLGGVHRVPQIAHIAGTNGKGSTAAFLATMGERAGRNVGLYTSPHLCKFSERIRVGGKPISDDALAEALATALELSAELTFFEVATLAALVAFRRANIDLAVVEVGLGGRLDATNIVEGPGVSVITRIAFDHTERLGDSIAAIAREKAGILRLGRPVVTGRLHPDAHAVVDAEAQRIGVRAIEATGEVERALVDTYPPSLPGPFQRQNAMAAVVAAMELGLPRTAISEGLVSTRWPGRCEVMETAEGYVLLDCAHNADGALALKNALLGFVTNFPRRNVGLVFGTMADKNWRAMLDRLSGVTGPRVYVQPRGRAATPQADLVAYLDGETALGPHEALAKARERVGRGGIVIVTGSIFLVGEVRAHLLGITCDPAIAL